MSAKKIFYMFMALASAIMSIIKEDTVIEIGYIVSMAFWVTLIVLEAIREEVKSNSDELISIVLKFQQDWLEIETIKAENLRKLDNKNITNHTQNS